MWPQKPPAAGIAPVGRPPSRKFIFSFVPPVFAGAAFDDGPVARREVNLGRSPGVWADCFTEPGVVTGGAFFRAPWFLVMGCFAFLVEGRASAWLFRAGRASPHPGTTVLPARPIGFGGFAHHLSERSSRGRYGGLSPSALCRRSPPPRPPPILVDRASCGSTGPRSGHSSAHSASASSARLACGRRAAHVLTLSRKLLQTTDGNLSVHAPPNWKEGEV